jgi:superfamily II DNA or RNA helicase
MWDKFCVEYEVDAKILSRGMLSRDDFELYKDYRYKDRDLVLIDESHHFRNASSRQYENLHTFMQARDAKAILLTATPYANSAEDIKNQIMLFHSSPVTTIPPAEGNLDRYFTAVKKGEANLVDLLRNIMIRRTRRSVLNQWGKKDENGRKYLEVGKKDRLYFPNREMQTLEYQIEKVYQKNYNKIVDRLSQEQIKFARYSPGLYLKKEYQNKSPYNELKTTGPKLVALMRHLLLKRMESSLASFQDSITNLIKVHRLFLDLLNEGIMPIGEVLQKEMYETALNEPDWVDDARKIQELAEKVKSNEDIKYELKAFELVNLKKDVEFDLETLTEISDLIGKLSWKTDDKLQRLQGLLSMFSDKKILVFTEFATTAKYLDRYLNWKGNKKQVDSGTTKHLEILQRFDPENNNFANDKIKKEDQISLIISTDVLSEGVNLQAGQVVINYDFHWNPVRLIQRAGRVDRIGSKHEVIHIFNFLPDPTIEHDLHLEGIVSSKIDEIQRVIGEDYKILKETENVNEEDIYAIYKNQESILDKQDKDNPLEPSEYEAIIADIQLKNPEFWERFIHIPDGIRSCEGESNAGKVLLVCESGSLKSGRIRKYYLIETNRKVKSISGDEALKLLKVNTQAEISKCPSNYNELISIGWREFMDDVEQIQAKEYSGPKKTIAQKWIIDRLMKMSNLDRFKEKGEEIQTLLKAFSIPISHGKLNREMRKIQGTIDDEEIFVRLEKLYQNFELQKEIEKETTEASPPRILYSKYIGHKK